MKTPLRIFIGAVLRGHGQLFLANDPVSGFLILVGLLLVAPESALCGLLSAIFVTGAGWVWCRRTVDFEAGLFGVNGVLLGLTGSYMPEVAPLERAGLMLGGSVVLVLILVPGVTVLRQRGSALTLFALPAIVVSFGMLALAGYLGRADTRLRQGWQALYLGDAATARDYFREAQVDTARARAYREDGLGWAEFYLGRHAMARDHFLAVLEVRPDFTDAQEGLGWCSFRLANVAEARIAFESAVASDPWRADSWDGLGWLKLANGDNAGAAACFQRAIATAPLLADAHAGLAQCRRRTDSPVPSFLATALQRYVGPRLQRTSFLQMVCWLLFLAAIAYHSRISLVVAMIVLLGCAILALVSTKLGQFLTEAAFVYNLLPLLLALGGKCLRLSVINTVWCVVASLLLGMLWALLAPLFLTLGLPLLCLPFHVLLGLSLVIYAIVDRRSLIPLEIAVGSADEVRVWLVKREIVDSCWEFIRRGRGTCLAGKVTGDGERGCVSAPSALRFR